MRLSDLQICDYQRDGFLIFPDLLSAKEVAALREEADRLAAVDSDLVRRERNGAIRTIFRVHEDNGPTRSPEFYTLSRVPRILHPAMQLLNDERVYIFHTKINLKPALEGTIWAWHQDYGTWHRDGLPTSNIVTALVMLDDAEEIGGALYLVPGSHRIGDIEHIEDAGIAALNQYSVSREPLKAVLEATKPVPVTGRAGTVALFHCNVIHGSGHNMSARDRRQLYIVYNPVDNKPQNVTNPRPDHLSSRNHVPLVAGSDDAILQVRSRTLTPA